MINTNRSYHCRRDGSGLVRRIGLNDFQAAIAEMTRDLNPRPAPHEITTVVSVLRVGLALRDVFERDEHAGSDLDIHMDWQRL
jgi:hypothetical protein